MATRPVGLVIALYLMGLQSGMAAAPIDAAVQHFVQTQVDKRWGPAKIEVGTPDPRLTLAPCQTHEPYLLPGSALWGRTVVGVRCTQGAHWSITMPVTVTLHGLAWTADQPLPAGTRIEPNQIRQSRVELTRDPGTPVTDLSQLTGRTLTRRLNPGDILRLEHFKATVTVQTGDPVRIHLQGNQFVIQSDGFALQPGAEGQTLRIRTDSGRVLSGTLRGRTVEVLL